MKRATRRKTQRALGALVKQRELEERKALERVIKTRVAVRVQEARAEAMRARRQDGDEAPRHAEASTTGSDIEALSIDRARGGDVIRQRAFVDTLRRAEGAERDKLAVHEKQLSDLQELYGEARARRRLLESIRDRRQQEVDAARDRADDESAPLARRGEKITSESH